MLTGWDSGPTGYAAGVGRVISRGAPVLGAALVVIALAVRAGGAGTPALHYDESVGSDLRAVAAATWERFLDAFSGRMGCFGDVRLVASADLADRAGYHAATATVAVRVPATASLLQASLVHEFAHHVEANCPEHRQLRSAFVASQGAGDGADWFRGDRWEAIPSEQYAEATVQLVLGHRLGSRPVALSPEAVAAVAAWAQGD